MLDAALCPCYVCHTPQPTHYEMPSTPLRSITEMRFALLHRLHIGELEARNRAMISELDTARMELDNKIREKRELMQAHAAYVEEMERQHA